MCRLDPSFDKVEKRFRVYKESHRLLSRLLSVEFFVNIGPDQVLFIPSAIYQPARPSLFSNAFHRSEMDIDCEQIASFHIVLQTAHLPPSIQLGCALPIRIMSKHCSAVKNNR